MIRTRKGFLTIFPSHTTRENRILKIFKNFGYLASLGVTVVVKFSDANLTKNFINKIFENFQKIGHCASKALLGHFGVYFSRLRRENITREIKTSRETRPRRRRGRHRALLAREYALRVHISGPPESNQRVSNFLSPAEN